MNHRHSVQQASIIANKCMEFLQKYDLPTTPVNYSVAYELVLGKNDSLVQAVKDLADKDLLDAFRFKELYQTHIEPNHDLQDKMLDPLAHVLGSMMAYSAASARSTETYQCELEQGQQLESASNPQEIIAALAKATHRVSAEQSALSQRLTEAEKEVRALKTNLEQLEIEAITDPLSELSNRKGLEKTLEEEPMSHAVNCLGIFDIDHFKKINDNYGHNFGDYVIRQVAREIKNHIRGADIAVRWGGEEFLLVLRDTDLKGATFVGNKIREAIRGLRWKNTRTGEQLPAVTISGGLAQVEPGETSFSKLDSVVERADSCLYRAKQGGRNRICA